MRHSFAWKCGLLVFLVGVSMAFAADAQSEKGHAAGRPPLLDAAFQAFLAHQGRWAYTETHSGNGSNGKPKAESIVRIDPSQPYAQQRVPIKVSGRDPSAKELKEWADHNEKVAKRRQEKTTDAVGEGASEEEYHLPILNQLVVPELDHATVLAEDDTGVTYDVPLHKVGDTAAKRYDAFQLTARVNKQQQQFEKVTMRQRSIVRVAAAKYSDCLIEIEFGSPDPRYPALPVKLSERMKNKPLFGDGVSMEDISTRTDLKHVTPYDERFGVKMGPSRVIEF